MNIGDIAKLAGVSKATVSRYFNHGYLSEEKREAVRQVVEETGYRPNQQAQTLRTRKSRTVGVILPRLDSISLSRITSGILTTLNVNHYHVMLADTQGDAALEIAYMKSLREQHVDGMILLATVFTPEHQNLLEKLQIPFVVTGQNDVSCDCVCQDDYHALYDMTSLVLGKGRKKIGYIGALKQDLAIGEERYRGFCDAVTQAGREDLKANFVITGFSIREGYDGARMLLDRHPDLDAIICATDEIAAGTIHYLKEQGIHIPEQMMVTGVDDSLTAHVMTPSLTTVHYNYEESGATAANLLLERFSDQQSGVDPFPKQQVVMPYRIVEMESTGADVNVPLPSRDGTI